MKKHIDVSIVIVNYKVKESLFNLLSSIYKYKTKYSFEIIVVDNSDYEKSLKNELRKIFPKVIYQKSGENLGYGKGNNLGVSLSKGEHVLVLNPDTIFLNNVIDPLVNFYKKNKNIGVVSPLLYNEKNLPYSLQGTKMLTPRRAFFSLSFLNKLFPKNKISKEYWIKNWNKKKLKEVDIVPGTAFLIRKDIFEKLGGFDINFFLYFEEFDFCKRLKDLGLKNYIIPSSKLFHEWGVSTSKIENKDKYFNESRYYYFKKHFGALKAIALEAFLRISKNVILILFILFLAYVLRIYKINENLPFIGDIAWYFYQAKELIVDGKFPLVGITSSHTWLHQGAFWTYLLSIILPIGNYNPFFPSYITAFLDLFTIIIIFNLSKKYFNIRTAYFSGIFYAVSPLVISHVQMAYHTSLIPMSTAIFLFCIYKFINGKVIFFPLSFFMIGILYNLEIATVSLVLAFFGLLFYGLILKKVWFKNVINKKIIFYSFIALLIPMTPMIIYDLENGFKQTLMVGVWMAYRVAVAFGYPPLNPDFKGEIWGTFFPYLFNEAKRFYFIYSQNISLLIFLLSVVSLLYSYIKDKFKNDNQLILIVFILIPISAYIFAKTNSAAYLLMFFPQLAIAFGYFLSRFKSRFFYVSLISIFIILIFNTYYIFTINPYGSLDLNRRIESTDEIIRIVDERPFNIVGEGSWSQFESFTTNYKYLLWWKGSPVSNKDEKLKLYVSEPFDRIIIRTVYEK